MANIIEYTLSLQDKWSGVMRKIGIENDAQLKKWAEIQQKVVGADRTMRTMGTTVGSLRERVAALRAERDWIPASNIQAIRHTNREITALERKVRMLETSVRGRLRTAFKNALTGLPFGSMLLNPLVLAATAAGAALKKGFEREKIQIAFEVLTGDKSAGQKLLKEIQKYAAANPIYQAGDLQENAKMMLSFGIAQERIMPNMKMLGDIAMGDKNKLDALTLAFSQMTSTGRLTGQDLLQMINAGFNPLNEISKKTGKSVAVLRDEMSKGRISSEMVRDAFVSATSAGGQFHGMVEQLSDSKSGKWSTAMNQAVSLLWKLYDVIEPLLIPVFAVLLGVIKLVGWALDGVNFIVSAFVKAIVWWKDKLLEGQPAIVILTTLIGAFGLALLAVKVPMMATAAWAGIVAAAKAVWAGVQAVLNAVLYACPLVWIITLIIALIAVIAYVCYKTEGWGSLWEGVVGFMKHTFLGYIELIKLSWTTLINGIMIGLDKVKLGWYKFKEAVGMGNSAENQAAIAKINADVEARQRAIVDGARKVAEHAQAAKDSLSGINMTWNKEKTLGSMIGGMKGAMGIGTPGVPGMEGEGGNQNGAGGNGGGTGSQTVDSIATGGSKSTTINITLGNLVENIFYQGAFGETKEEFEQNMQSALLRLLHTAANAQ